MKSTVMSAKLKWTRLDHTTWTAPHPAGGEYAIRKVGDGYQLMLDALPGRPLRRYRRYETVAEAKRIAQLILVGFW
jgi:hypothetical protein